MNLQVYSQYVAEALTFLPKIDNLIFGISTLGHAFGPYLLHLLSISAVRKLILSIRGDIKVMKYFALLYKLSGWLLVKWNKHSLLAYKDLKNCNTSGVGLVYNIYYSFLANIIVCYGRAMKSSILFWFLIKFHVNIIVILLVFVCKNDRWNLAQLSRQWHTNNIFSYEHFYSSNQN